MMMVMMMLMMVMMMMMVMTLMARMLRYLRPVACAITDSPRPTPCCTTSVLQAMTHRHTHTRAPGTSTHVPRLPSTRAEINFLHRLAAPPAHVVRTGTNPAPPA